MNLRAGGITNGEASLRYPCAPDLPRGNPIIDFQQAIFTPRTLKGGGTMDSPFFDVAYRIVAIAVGYACGRQVWDGYVERKITPWRNLLDFYKQVFHRDTEPVRYWIEMALQAIGMVACFIAAIIGWWQPNT